MELVTVRWVLAVSGEPNGKKNRIKPFRHTFSW